MPCINRQTARDILETALCPSRVSWQHNRSRCCCRYCVNFLMRVATREGASASEQWCKCTEAREISDVYRVECKHDTYAMYAIWRVLQAGCIQDIENQKRRRGDLERELCRNACSVKFP